MSIKEFLKPTLWKIIIASIIGIACIVYLLTRPIYTLAVVCNKVECTGFQFPDIVKNSCDPCTSFSKFFYELTFAIIIPFATGFLATYLIYSAISWIITRGRK
jgi:hypothetical protein